MGRLRCLRYAILLSDPFFRLEYRTIACWVTRKQKLYQSADALKSISIMAAMGFKQTLCKMLSFNRNRIPRFPSVCDHVSGMSPVLGVGLYLFLGGGAPYCVSREIFANE